MCCVALQGHFQSMKKQTQCFHQGLHIHAHNPPNAGVYYKEIIKHQLYEF